jgi:hypothetical protein
VFQIEETRGLVWFQIAGAYPGNFLREMLYLNGTAILQFTPGGRDRHIRGKIKGGASFGFDILKRPAIAKGAR